METTIMENQMEKKMENEMETGYKYSSQDSMEHYLLLLSQAHGFRWEMVRSD